MKTLQCTVNDDSVSESYFAYKHSKNTKYKIQHSCCKEINTEK